MAVGDEKEAISAPGATPPVRDEKLSTKAEDEGVKLASEKADDVDYSRKAHYDVVENAKAAAHKEQKMSLLQGIKLYPKAIAWSVLISTTIVMEGYDISLVNNFCMCPCLSHHEVRTDPP